jgi:hypothetical protein
MTELNLARRQIERKQDGDAERPLELGVQAQPEARHDTLVQPVGFIFEIGRHVVCPSHGCHFGGIRIEPIAAVPERLFDLKAGGITARENS